jgi:hypothetical protein
VADMGPSGHRVRLSAVNVQIHCPEPTQKFDIQVGADSGVPGVIEQETKPQGLSTSA